MVGLVWGWFRVGLGLVQDVLGLVSGWFGAGWQVSRVFGVASGHPATRLPARPSGHPGIRPGHPAIHTNSI